MKAHEYDLDLDVDYPDGAFRGSVTIIASDLRGTVELDSEDLALTTARVDDRPVPFRLDASRSKVLVEAGDPGGSRLRLEYSGKASHSSLSGLYVSASGEQPVLTTMMQPISCRRLLPCLDTPDQKAVFRVRVTTDPRQTVLANAGLVETESVAGGKRWTFAPTPPMATYLLYLGIGPFETIEVEEDGIRHIAATLPGKIDRTRMMLSYSGPLVRAYGSYYGQPYPLPKLHLVAVPDLWAGAMENWGAIAFPEVGLLVDDATSPAIRRWAMETISHEIAHQWFGNLVTMETFDDLWLNESFATFVAAKMEVQLGMRSNAWEEFLIRIRPAYFGDSLESTHPIRLDISDPKAIAESTDEITYFKGASVVRMIDAYLGEAVFRRGVVAYLDRFRFGNARGDDLWTSLAAVSGEPVTEVLRPWVERPGLPIVRVRKVSGGLRLEQCRFLFSDSHRVDEPWPIPLTLLGGGTSQRLLFRTRTLDVPWDSDEPVRLNPGRSAFVRVWYDPELRRRMVLEVQHLEPASRWALINDTAAFLLSGDATVAEYLELVAAGQEFTDYPSILELVSSLRFLDTAIGESSGFRDAAVRFLRAQVDRVTASPRDGEADTDAVIRQEVFRSLVHLDPNFAEELAGRFGEMDRLPAALRPAVGYAYARAGGPEALGALVQWARSAADEDGALSAGDALGGLPTLLLLREALRTVLEPGIRDSVAHNIVVAVGENPLGRELAWTWLQENLRELERRTQGSWSLARLLERVLPHVGIGRLAEVEAYFARESFPEAANGIRKSLEVLRLTEGLASRSGTTVR